MYVKRNTEARSLNHYCRGKETSTVLHILSVCVSEAVVTQQAMRMRHIVSTVAHLAVRYFFTLSHKRHDFRGGGWWGVTEYKM
jgi:hypothetical protein